MYERRNPFLRCKYHSLLRALSPHLGSTLLNPSTRHLHHWFLYLGASSAMYILSYASHDCTVTLKVSHTLLLHLSTLGHCLAGTMPTQSRKIGHLADDASAIFGEQCLMGTFSIYRAVNMTMKKLVYENMYLLLQSKLNTKRQAWQQASMAT